MERLRQIRENLEKWHPIPDADWLFFAQKLVEVRLAKKALLLECGQVEGYLSFVESGLVRLVIPDQGAGQTFGFVTEGEFLCAYDSFVWQSPSDYQVETLTEVVLWRLNFADLQQIYRETTVGNTLGRRIAEGLFLNKSKRERSLLVDTAAQRYERLFVEKPQWIQRIPLKYLASYIGISPQALSRIRRRIS
ncbi:Crp/Fnr family transcriptional regulator [Flavobacterium sp. JP2137]|uniref:Crp/Fnr family transcriptional regulator n=1 Tax=Flavobacterium sp. JP2137 TaxID=3414510 RepID=UPI003D2FEEE0